ncbi:MAG: hypothetical protein EPO07_02325 [Verrucomicrobia bacterium]|nr:MAG: hypothetical protein EPO07_02325 [Verrucomicrobiota bacterium]
MTASDSISIPERTGKIGSDVFQYLVALVRNRTGDDFHAAFNSVMPANSDLMQTGYGNFDSARDFSKLLNRVENRSGLSAGPSLERSAGDIAVLTKRFAPQFNWEPTAVQWDLLRRTADELERAGVPERLFNRAPEGVTASDWNTAQKMADGVRALLDSEMTDPVDRGPILEYAQPAQIRGVFRRAVERLMTEQSLSLRQAFDRLKETEPIFWTMAMLSFEPEGDS